MNIWNRYGVHKRYQTWLQHQKKCDPVSFLLLGTELISKPTINLVSFENLPDAITASVLSANTEIDSLWSLSERTNPVSSMDKRNMRLSALACLDLEVGKILQYLLLNHDEIFANFKQEMGLNLETLYTPDYYTFTYTLQAYSKNRLPENLVHRAGALDIHNSHLDLSQGESAIFRVHITWMTILTCSCTSAPVQTYQQTDLLTYDGISALMIWLDDITVHYNVPDVDLLNIVETIHKMANTQLECAERCGTHLDIAHVLTEENVQALVSPLLYDCEQSGWKGQPEGTSQAIRWRHLAKAGVSRRSKRLVKHKTGYDTP